MPWLLFEAVQARSTSVLVAAVAVKFAGAVGGWTGVLRNATIWMTHWPDAVAVPRYVPAVAAILSSAMSLSGVVMTLLVNPAPAALVLPVVVFAAKSSSFGPLVVSALVAFPDVLPDPVAVALSGAAVSSPEYSRMRMSTQTAATL